MSVAMMLYLGIFSARAQTPGGVSNTNYVWSTWLTPDSYNGSGTWANLITTQGTLGNFTNLGTAPSKSLTGGSNFHQPVRFMDFANRLQSQYNNNIVIGDNLTVILVMSRSGSTANDYQRILNFGTGSNTYQFWYYGVNGPFFAWGNGTYFPTSSSSGLSFSGTGVFVSSFTNTAVTDRLQQYINGVQRASSGTNILPAANANRVLISSETLAGYRGFNGTIHELIVLKASGAYNHINYADLQQINSYLGIKYGIMINNNDHWVVSGNTVWDRSANNGYNNNIFGIGRNDNSRLYQKQSRSENSDFLTLFVGNSLASFNSENTTGTLSDNQFLMLGSNGIYNTGKQNYVYPANTVFAGGTSITEKINYRSGTIFKAQVTGGSTQITVNMKVSSLNAKYVIVSNGNTFIPGSTRVYPISAQIATGVVVNNGDFISLAGYESTPGGLDMVTNGYALDLWVDGNNSTNSSWTNLAQSSYMLQRFSDYAPTVRNSRFNYQNELYFGNATSSKLRTSTNYDLSAGISYYIFAVSDAEGSGTADATLLTFNNNIGNTSLRWNNSSATNIFSSYWTTTQRSPNFSTTSATEPFSRYGITSLNINNSNNSSGNQLQLNGVFNTNSTFNLGTGGAGASSPTTKVPLLIGNANNGTAAQSTNPFNGSIQEIIIMRRSGGALMSPNDVAKVQTYLALKYGIPLRPHLSNKNSGDNYLNSAGTVVWNRAANNGYNNHIFGIGRDDESGLYQKQSRSVTNRGFVAYVGNLDPMLNSKNTGTLDDMQYLLFGCQNDGKTVMPLAEGTIAANAPYKNGNLTGSQDFNIQSSAYKTQLTGVTSMAVKLVAPSKDFSHILVSSRADFHPDYTNFYELDVTGVAEVTVGTVDDYKYIKFIGFSPGPGGITAGLALWLRADDESSIDILNFSPGETGVLNYTGRLDDPTNVPAVNSWSDLARDKKYTYTAAHAGNTNNTFHRYPVLKYHSPEMNYYPAVNFWGDAGGTYGSFLGNPQGILTTAVPQYHTAVFLVNNDFGRHTWVYPMMFGSEHSRTGAETYYGPGYGIQKITGANQITTGRFRTSSSQGVGTLDLFSPGATTILNYQVIGENSGTDNRTVRFRFNGKENGNINGTGSTTISNNKYTVGSFNMTRGSQIGKGYDYDRTIIGDMSEAIIFDRALTQDETTKMESYLALKYGITLRPNNTSFNRFDYKFSDGKIIWGGETWTGDYINFYNNVAAIVCDEAARLNNRQSHSTNVGSILHLGVAGDHLSFNGNITELGTLNNMEAVAFGNTSTTGIVTIPYEQQCRGFEQRFERVWLIHKETENDRPVELLVGAQNNSMLTIGADDDVMNNYYNKLDGSNDVYMCVASSIADMNAENYRTIPMEYYNGEYQCIYTFTEKDTYITFGFRPNGNGCLPNEDAVFQGTKFYRWLNWTASSSRTRVTGTTTVSLPGAYGALGDNINVTNTQVHFPSPTYSPAGYPRSVSNTLGQGTLQVQRSGGSTGTAGEVTIQIDIDNPVIPEFIIGGLDAYSRSYEEVEIYGECGGTTRFIPTLSAISTNPTYKISGGKATVFRDVSATAADQNTQVRVRFNGGVTKVIIKFRITGRSISTTRSIWISPMSFTTVLPPAKINIDGLSFVKRADKASYQSCEEPVFTFEIGNAVCDEWLVTFSDTLPEHMRWENGLFGLDSLGADLNPSFNPVITDLVPGSGDGRVVTIVDLVVPRANTLTMLATTKFDPVNTTTGYYRNRAKIEYWRVENSVDVIGDLYSYDNSNPNKDERDYTTFWVEYAPIPDDVTVKDSYSQLTYREDDEVLVTYKIENPNADLITDAFFSVTYNDEFSLVAGSLKIEWENPAETTTIPKLGDSGTGSLLISGVAGSVDDGFTLPSTPLIISFKLKAPASALEDDMNPTGKIDLVIDYNLSSGMDDICLLRAIADAYGSVEIPYSTYYFTVNGKTNAVVNGTRFCNVNDFEFEGFPKDLLASPTTVQWYLHYASSVIPIPSDAGDQTIAHLSLADGGPYTVEMRVNSTTGQVSLITQFYVGGIPILWTPEANTGATDAQKQNWNNALNWTPQIVPDSCNNVFLPGNSSHYPRLTSNAYANYIYFIQGAELGRPDSLKYRRAYIQMNFDLKEFGQRRIDDSTLVLESYRTIDRLNYSAAVSAAPLARERWNMLSSPLRGVYTGDFGFGGFPLTFLMKFGPITKDGVDYNIGQWTTPYTGLGVELTATEGFAFYMYGFGMTSDNTGALEYGFYSDLNDDRFVPSTRMLETYGLEKVNGIIELPFFDDETGMHAHRTQMYKPGTKESTFYYIHDGVSPVGRANDFMPDSVNIIRQTDDGNYRFIPETRSGANWVFPRYTNHSGVGLGGGDDFMVGNPYMSAIDMGAFLTANISTLQQNFKIWNDATSSFVSYYNRSGTIYDAETGGTAVAGHLAPLQGFFLTTASGYAGAGNVAQFDVTTTTTRPPNTASNLRSAATPENKLRIKAENNSSASFMLIGYDENAVAGFGENIDVRKLFSSYSSVPEIYALAGEVPADIRFIKNAGEMVVPLGIRTNYVGEIRLIFSGMDNYTKTSKIELVDALLDRTIDLTKETNYTYTFNNTEKGINNGRFSIRFGKSPTALPGVNVPDDLNVFGNSDGIYVVSSDPVERISIYDFQGRIVFESTSGAKYYPIQGNLKNSPLIVKVITKNGMKTVKLNNVK